MNTLTDNRIYVDQPDDAEATIVDVANADSAETTADEASSTPVVTDDSSPLPSSNDSDISSSLPSTELFTKDEADKMAREAFLRGRNEAIAAAMTPATTGNHTPGVSDPATPPSDPALAAIFSLRPSVWT